MYLQTLAAGLGIRYHFPILFSINCDSSVYNKADKVLLDRICHKTYMSHVETRVMYYLKQVIPYKPNMGHVTYSVGISFSTLTNTF